MKFIKSKKRTKLLFAVLLVLVFLGPRVVYGGGDLGEVPEGGGFWGSIVSGILKPFVGAAEFVINGAVSAVLQLFFAFAGFLLTWAMAAVDLATSSVLLDQVFFSPAAQNGINAGWGLVRDFVNMFFILILVFLAIATILRINKFSDKRLLFFVIFAALLVNFSKPITIFVIDISNLAMAFFIDNIQAANTSYSTTLLKNMDFKDALWADIAGGDMDMARYIGMLVGAAFKFILAVMLFVLAIALIVRIIALWVLIVLSPLAFFGIALPGTFLSGLKDGWVKKLVYWCFFGPVLLFFLWLALVMVDAVTQTINTPGLQSELKFEGLDFGEATKTFILGALRITIPYIAAIYMLFYGYSLTKSMSAGVGNSVLGLMNRGQGFMSRWGKRGAAVAGTMATAGLGYLGYKQYQAAKTGLAQNERIPFTEASRKKADAKRTARWAGRGKPYSAGEVNEQLKNWDETGAPTVDELQKELESGKGVKRQAAALRLAKEGELRREDYQRAMQAFKNNPQLAQRFQQSAKKHNLYAKLEYDIDQAISREKASLGGAPVGATKEQEIRDEAYNKALEGMSLAKIKDQDINFHKSAEFRAHMRKRIASGSETVENLRKQDMGGDIKREWERQRWFAPDTGESDGSGI